MSIAVLNQVYDETRRLVIAGSGLAVGDFRLKKLVEPLKKSGAKAPVFAKVAQSIETLVDGKEKDSPQALLDLSSLVLAVLYTQGETGVKGTAKPIESLDLGISTTQVSSRVLKPLMEALTNTGSGRFETVREAFDRGAFNDLRLINPAINALDDKFPDLADYMADTVLPKFGPAIIPEIKDRIDIKGRAGHPRRLRLLYRLDPKTARPIVEDAFENGSKEMKIAALGCLGDSKEDLPHLLEQAVAKAKDVRRVAIDRLAGFSGADVEAIFQKSISNADVDLIVAPLQRTKDAKLIRLAHEQTQACLAETLSTKDKKKVVKLVDRLDTLLCCFLHRNDKTTVAMLLDIFEKRKELRAKPGGDALLSTLFDLMLFSNDKKLHKSLGSIHAESEVEGGFTAVLLAALTTMPAKKAFDELSGYYVANQTRKQQPKNEEITSLLCANFYYHSGHNHHLFSAYGNRNNTAQQLIESIKWDPRWLALAIKNNDPEVVCNLAEAKDKAAISFLADFVAKAKPSGYWEIYNCLEKLVDVKYQDVTQIIINLINANAKKKGYRYGLYGAFELISRLPKSSAKAIEASLDGLPDSYIDLIMPHLITLKQKGK